MSVDSAVTEDTQALATQLGEAIADLPEYETFLEAKQAVEASDEAQERIRDFERLREEFLIARQSGDATEDDLRELQEAQAALNEIPVVSEFLEAQSSLEVALQDVNEAISEPLALDFGEKASSCCAE